MSSTLVSRANRYMLRSTPDLNTLAARPANGQLHPNASLPARAHLRGCERLERTQSRRDTRHRCQIAHVSVDDAEQRDHRGLVRSDAVKIAHTLSSKEWLANRSANTFHVRSHCETRCSLNRFTIIHHRSLSE
jgi:hypothetical protein